MDQSGMTEEPYLIAHKVRGEAAFDVAIKMPCPLCNNDYEPGIQGCPECQEEGFWWIIPTSGHRAYPYWVRPVEDFVFIDDNGIHSDSMTTIPMPSLEEWPDHYQCDIDKATLAAINPTDVAKAQSLLQSLGLLKPKEPLRRRV